MSPLRAYSRSAVSPQTPLNKKTANNPLPQTLARASGPSFFPSPLIPDRASETPRRSSTGPVGVALAAIAVAMPPYHWFGLSRLKPLPPKTADRRPKSADRRSWCVAPRRGTTTVSESRAGDFLLREFFRPKENIRRERPHHQPISAVPATPRRQSSAVRQRSPAPPASSSGWPESPPYPARAEFFPP